MKRKKKKILLDASLYQKKEKNIIEMNRNMMYLKQNYQQLLIQFAAGVMRPPILLTESFHYRGMNISVSFQLILLSQLLSSIQTCKKTNIFIYSILSLLLPQCLNSLGFSLTKLGYPFPIYTHLEACFLNSNQARVYAQ